MCYCCGTLAHSPLVRHTQLATSGFTPATPANILVCTLPSKHALTLGTAKECHYRFNVLQDSQLDLERSGIAAVAVAVVAVAAIFAAVATVKRGSNGVQPTTTTPTT